MLRFWQYNRNMKIYTKTGDNGETSLFGGDRVPKSSERINATGSIDELNAVLGVAESFCQNDTCQPIIRQLQNDCFRMGADIATLLSHPHKIERIEPQDTAGLEKIIDDIEASLPPLHNFILPGGAQCAAYLHLARTVCRRAERNMSHLQTQEDMNPEILKFLNRLSDLLFVMARVVNKNAGQEDIPWHPRQPSSSPY